MSISRRPTSAVHRINPTNSTCTCSVQRM